MGLCMYNGHAQPTGDLSVHDTLIGFINRTSMEKTHFMIYLRKLLSNIK